MKCKYYDCGWCYAPEGVKNNAIQGGCFEPEYCATYLMQKKPIMTEQEHLECEIKELELEIEGHNKAIQNLKNVQERRKQKLIELENQRNPMKSFNINQIVKVRLTKYGKELHKKEWEDFWNSYGKLNKYPYEPPKEDENGYVEFQMWDLMEKFGNHCGVCKELAFENIILIDEKDLK